MQQGVRQTRVNGGLDLAEWWSCWRGASLPALKGIRREWEVVFALAMPG